uniref:Uncharacterized protein n=1 Tax=Escherichia coli TaxID=562 RepID=T2HSL3_ECOLX|nr:hypothetical protein [Escherichia coli]
MVLTASCTTLSSTQDMASGLLLPSSFGISVILVGLGQYVPRRKRRSKPLIFSSSCSPQLAFVTRSIPTALFPSRCRNLLFQHVLIDEVSKIAEHDRPVTG